MAHSNSLNHEILLLAQTHYTPSSSLPRSLSPNSIYGIQSTVRDVKPRAYTPRVISIGLIHCSTIPSMDELKGIYMSSLFKRTVPPQETNERNQRELCKKTSHRCVNAMMEMADRVKTCYSSSPECSKITAKITARTMLLDGCFILELLMKFFYPTKNKDTIFDTRLELNNVEHDLLLLENQIPFFVLEELFEHTVKRIDSLRHLSLKELILEFFGNKLNPSFKLKIESGSQRENEVDHILGLLHSCYKPRVSHPGDYMISKYSATELHRSGVNFKTSKGNEEVYLHVEFKSPCLFSGFTKIFCCTKSLPVSVSETARKARCCCLSFLCQLCCRATLEIPELCITDSTESFLRNLIAYEQCSKKNIPRYITSYAFLMDTLINSKEHVELLETSGVLKNYLGSGENASNLFNSLCEEVDLGDFYFSKQWEQADAYYRLYWPSRIASLRRNYFSNPWTGVSVFAALILFAFTGIQTLCSIIGIW